MRRSRGTGAQEPGSGRSADERHDLVLEMLGRHAPKAALGIPQPAPEDESEHDAGPRDGIMIGLAKRGLSVRVARTAIELSVLVLGVLLGGTIGIGTVAFTFGIGPLVQVFLPPLALPPRKTPAAVAA